MKVSGGVYNLDKVSIEGIMYRRDIVRDENIKDDRYKVLISKSLQNMPKDEREKAISEIIFCIFNDYGKIISNNLCHILNIR